jgi:hypothetical protein
MSSTLIFALATVFIALIVFGERMGLGGELASLGMLTVIAGAAIAVALFSMTTRLARFTIGPERGPAIGSLAIINALLAFGIGIAISTSRDPRSAMPVVLIAFWAAAMATPKQHWRNRGFGHDKQGRLALVERGQIGRTRGTLTALGCATFGLGVLVLLRHFSSLVDALAEATAWPRGTVLAFSAGLPGLLAILGGMQAIARAALVLLAIAGITLLAPFLANFAAGMGDRFDLTLILGNPRELTTSLLANLPRPTLADWPVGMLGFALGLAARQISMPVRSVPARFGVILFGSAMAVVWIAIQHVDSAAISEILTRRIIESGPAQWPVFVFDDSLRGWLGVCGEFPEDAFAAMRACGRTNVNTALPAGSVIVAKKLSMPALALSFGWPASLGLVWALLPYLFGFLALATLLQASASGISEFVLLPVFFSRALRSWRLALARIVLLALVGLLIAFDHSGWRLSPALYHWGLASFFGIGGLAILAYWMILAIRLARKRREQRLSPIPALVSSPVIR